MSAKCLICESDLENYCTTNVCKDCCELGKCPSNGWCVAYPVVLEDLLKRYRENEQEADVPI